MHASRGEGAHWVTRWQITVAKKFFGAMPASVLTNSGVWITGPRGASWIGLDRPRPEDCKRRITWIEDKPDSALLPAGWPPGAVVMFGGNVPFNDVDEAVCGDPVRVLFGTPAALVALKDAHEPGVVRCAGYVLADDTVHPFTEVDMLGLTIWETLCRENKAHARKLMAKACKLVRSAVHDAGWTQSSTTKRNWFVQKPHLSKCRSDRPRVTISAGSQLAAKAHDSDDADDVDDSDDAGSDDDDSKVGGSDDESEADGDCGDDSKADDSTADSDNSDTDESAVLHPVARIGQF